MNSPASKLVLGTVQFGCNYGINSAGRPSGAEVQRILDLALGSGITTLDTSSAYGDAESVIGSCGAARFRLVSKYPEGGGNIADALRASLQRLRTDSLHGYLLHHFSVWRRDAGVWDEFKRLRDSGLSDRIGFSLYSPEELELLLENGVDFSLLQFPRNILDRQFDQYLPELKSRGVEIHVRSTFLQGLFFKDRLALPQKLLPLRDALEQIDREAVSLGISVSDLALSFNLCNPLIDGVLIGVDNAAQLQADLASAASSRAIDLDINVTKRELLNPVNWK